MDRQKRICICGHPTTIHSQEGTCRLSDCPCLNFRSQRTADAPVTQIAKNALAALTKAGGGGRSEMSAIDPWAEIARLQKELDMAVVYHDECAKMIEDALDTDARKYNEGGPLFRHYASDIHRIRSERDELRIKWAKRKLGYTEAGEQERKGEL